MRLVRVLTVIVLVGLGAVSGRVVLQASGSRFITIDDPRGAQDKTQYVLGINPQGDMVGGDTDSNGAYHGFLLRRGHFIAVDEPMAGRSKGQGTNAHSINAQGDIVGGYFDSASIHHGFLLRRGRYTSIDDPKAVQHTSAWGIDARGDIVGNYSDSADTMHGFVLRQQGNQ